MYSRRFAGEFISVPDKSNPGCCGCCVDSENGYSEHLDDVVASNASGSAYEEHETLGSDSLRQYATGRPAAGPLARIHNEGIDSSSGRMLTREASINRCVGN